MPFTRVPVVAILALLPTAAIAQQADSLPRVVITATRVDVPAGASITASTVIDRAALQRTGVRDIAEVLRMVPGMSIARSGGPGAQSSVFLRGGENDYVRVLIDGVPVNDPGGAVDLAWLSVDDVDRIEVVRGPASVLYGTDAVSGVVQVFTRRSTGQLVDAEVSAGRYGTSLMRGSLSTRVDRLDVTFGAARERSNGLLAFNSDYGRDVLTAAFRARPAAATRVDLTLRRVNDEYHYPTDGAGAVEDQNAFRDNQRMIGAVAVSQAWSRLRAEFSLTAMNLRGIDDDQPDAAGDTLGFYYYDAQNRVRRRIADARLHVMLSPSSVLTVGAETVGEAQRGNDSSNYSFARSRFVADRHNDAVYGQWLSDLGPLSVTAGARWDENDTFGAFRTARAGLALRAWRGGTIRATVGTAFKAPTFFESFNTAFSTGNAELAPERSRSWEAGIRHVAHGGRLTMAATWFDQQFRDMIQYAFVSPDEPNYFNVAAASARGLEIEVSALPTSRVRAGASTTLLRTRVENAGLQSGDDATFVLGNRLLRRPSILVTGSLSVDLPGRSTTDLAVRYTGRGDDRDFVTFPASPVVLPAYTRVDVAFTRPVAAGWMGASLDFMLRVDNLLGAGYEEIVNYPAAGRSLTIGLRAASLRR